jgi:hypothetical protein
MNNKTIKVIFIIIVIGLNLFIDTTCDIASGCPINWKFNIVLSLAIGAYIYFLLKNLVSKILILKNI